MTTTKATESELNQDITTLEKQIGELSHYLVSLRQQLLPATSPSEASSTEALIEQAKVIAAKTQEIAIKAAEARAIETTLETLKGQLKAKQEDLLKLRQEQGFKLLETKALELNAATDRLIALVDEMQALNRKIQGGNFNPLSVDVNLRELPYADILPPSMIRVRTRPAIIDQQTTRARNKQIT